MPLFRLRQVSCTLSARQVRSAETDHELKMKTVPFISRDGKTILNTNEILKELQLNPGCHGEGPLYSSYCPVNFILACEKVFYLQHISPIPYGPFRYKGSNCSRFVNTAILAGNPSVKYKFRLKYLVPFTPTPMNNVNSLDHKMEIPKLLKGEPFCPIRKLDYTFLKSTLQAPVRHPDIPENALWLSGEGCGSWFVIEPDGPLLKVARYSPHGVIECTGLYENRNGNTLPTDQSIKITYPSNCKVISIIHKDQEMVFERTVI